MTFHAGVGYAEFIEGLLHGDLRGGDAVKVIVRPRVDEIKLLQRMDDGYARDAVELVASRIN